MSLIWYSTYGDTSLSASDTALNVMVASPVHDARVSVPLDCGAHVPLTCSVVPPAIVSLTVNVWPLLVYVAPRVAFAAVTVNLYSVEFHSMRYTGAVVGKSETSHGVCVVTATPLLLK